ncbi:MAG TPA: hypothetical protein PLK63_16245 [Catalimonadaceae bacterium]|nr:hypothetical protein [Catalimonadaceae bacterium]
MKATIYILLYLFLHSGIACLYGQTFTLTSATGKEFDDVWKCVVADHDGNTIIAGQFSDSVQIGDSLIVRSFSPTGPSLFVLKLNPQGKIIWVLKERNSFKSDPQAISMDRDGNFILAYYGNNANNFSENQVFTGADQGVGIVKISKNGQVMKRQFIKSHFTEFQTYAILKSMSTDKNKNLLFTGVFFGKISIPVSPGNDTSFLNDSSGYNVIIGKLDSNLNFCWAKRFYPSKRNYVPFKNPECNGNAVVADQDGNVIFVGDSKDTLFLDVERQQYLANHALADSNNRFISANPWIIKYTSAGEFIWGKMGQNPISGTVFNGVSVDQYNNIYVSGKGIGGYQASPPYFESDTGNVYQKQTGIIFNKFSPDGNVLWLNSTEIPNQFLGSGDGKFVIPDSAGNFYVAGGFFGRIDFDPGAATKLLISTNANLLPTATDFAVAKYSKKGQLFWVSRTTGTLSDPYLNSGATYNPKINSFMICGDYAGILRFNGIASPSYTSRQPSGSSTAVADGFYALISNSCLTRTQIHDTICYGTTKSFDGETLTKPGKYIRLKIYNPANQCEVWEELFLHVRPEIQASAGADISVCSGKVQSLGTDSLSGLSYQWQQIGGSFTSTQARPKPGYTNFSDSIQRYRFALQVTDSKGCQKRDTIQLALSPVLRASLAKTICPGETFEDYSTNGTFKDTLVSSHGCDSIRTLTLSYDIPNNSIQLSAEFGALAAPGQDGYQWLDCNAGFAPLPGETDSSFAPTVSGSYAVRVTKGNCADTSGCLFLVNTEPKIGTRSGLNIFPNPAQGFTTIDCPSCKEGQTIEIFSTEGSRIKSMNIGPNRRISVEGLPAGIFNVRAKGRHFIPEKLVIW